MPPICGRLNHIENLSHSRSRQTCSATERAKAGPIRGVGADVLRHDRQVAGLGAIALGLVDSTFRSASISHPWPSAFGADRSHQTGKKCTLCDRIETARVLGEKKVSHASLAKKWSVRPSYQGQIRRPRRPSDMPCDMPSDMSSEGHCILMAVWGEDDARVPALVLYA